MTNEDKFSNWLVQNKGRLISAPLLGGLLSLLPYYFLVVLVAERVGIDPSSPLRSQPGGEFFSHFMMIGAVVFLVAGSFVGVAVVVKWMSQDLACTKKDAWCAILSNPRKE